MTSTPALDRPGSPPAGRRDLHVWKRDAKIEASAKALALAGVWPSPHAVAARSGISEPVVRRRTAILLSARRTWVETTGRQHPQWRDPDAAEAPSAIPIAPEPDRSGPDEASWKEAEKEYRRTIRRLRARLAVSEEECRRHRLGVRPAEVDALLESGPAN